MNNDRDAFVNMDALDDSDSESSAYDPDVRYNLLPDTWITGGILFRDSPAANALGRKRYVRVPKDELSLEDDANFFLVDRFLRESGGWNLGEPRLLVNVFGDVGHAGEASVYLEPALRRLVGMNQNAWIFTDARSKQLTRAVGWAAKGMEEDWNSVENQECNVRVCNVGFGSWEKVRGRDKISDKETYDLSILNQAEEGETSEGGLSLLEENHTHFVLVEDGKLDGDEVRREVFRRMVAPKAQLLVGGDVSVSAVKGFTAGLSLSTPCILVEESGGLAKYLAQMVKRLKILPGTKASDHDIRSIVADYEKPESSENVSEAIIECLHRFKYMEVLEENMEKVQDLLILGYRKALGKNPEPVHQLDFMKLCCAWNNHVHLMKGLRACNMAGYDIHWYIECLKACLSSDNAMFIEALISSNESIFRSLSRKDLRDLYHSDGITLKTIREFIDGTTGDQHGFLDLLQEITELIDGTEFPSEADQKLDFKFHLFLWSVFSRHYNVARYFWQLSDYPIANGLIANTILKSLLENSQFQVNSDLQVDEARWYEEQSTHLLAKCNDRSPVRTKFLLVQELRQRGGVSCLNLATKDSFNSVFLSSRICIHHLRDVWYRCCKIDFWSQFKQLILCVFFLIFLIAILLCTYSEHESVIWGSALIAILSLVVFFLGICFLQTTGALRFDYSVFQTPSLDEERLDIKMLSKCQLSESEKRLLLTAGIPVDTIPLRRQAPSGLLSRMFFNTILFLEAPQTKFTFHLLTFSLYLFIFAFVVLTSTYDFASKLPTYFEWLLQLYWLAYFVQELKQVVRGDKGIDKMSFSSAIEYYWMNYWNRYDLLLFLYYIGLMTFRAVAYASTEPSRYFLVSVLNGYTFFFVLWCFRLLQIFTVSEFLGPKLLMIQAMILDFSHMITYILIFALAYAVWLKATIRTVEPGFLGTNSSSFDSGPNSAVDYLMSVNATQVFLYIDDLFSHPIWHVFGESFLDYYDDLIPKKEESDPLVYEYSVEVIKLYTPLIRVLYVSATTILLLNLIIAVFQYSINDKQEKARASWNASRKADILEYSNRAFLPAPLSLPIDLAYLFAVAVTCNGYVSVLPSSDKFVHSTLKLRIPAEVERDGIYRNNPMANWTEFIRKWEKLLHDHHMKSWSF